MVRLTIDAYVAMPYPDRRVFDDWLHDEELNNKRIREASFGEGCILATCIALPVTIVDDIVLCEQHTFPVKTPPPALIFQYCER